MPALRPGRRAEPDRLPTTGHGADVGGMVGTAASLPRQSSGRAGRGTPQADPATAWHSESVLVIDDSGDRKAGQRTARVGRQWLGRYGKTDNQQHGQPSTHVRDEQTRRHPRWSASPPGPNRGCARPRSPSPKSQALCGTCLCRCRALGHLGEGSRFGEFISSRRVVFFH
ncbi:transposase [Dactylosporangium sp. NPDC049525]|uniref:transposase n=1 Tax=Dactylosporangium sp. NPDC049525 TaxID=3154730 RepID=UPI00344B0004